MNVICLTSIILLTKGAYHVGHYTNIVSDKRYPDILAFPAGLGGPSGSMMYV